ncbi:phosphopantetheine adenylyltransferase [Agitococcus lubricus]|uniref:Phosphopantetheine adenylyltransferase n=1 Tax=Agitococcus lubricus TaxID=1077255 RepID=A0A2T5J3H9_9GAMM|nr:phosphopantetheine adenylyltransferase [Agitococcus lubricus]PTQ91174.1 hypothetical protein C8N29_101246 [Agitococcus lubricus]
MKLFESITLLLIGLIHFLPLLGVMGVKQLKTLYGVDLTDSSVILLMRHRAVLFGIVGGLIMYSVFFPTLLAVAYIVGAISMASFVVLALPIKNHTPALKKVFYIDMIGLIMLLVSCLGATFFS